MIVNTISSGAVLEQGGRSSTPSGGAIQSINGDTTPAQIIQLNGEQIPTVNGVTNIVVEGGSSDPVIDLVPSTLVNGEVFIAIFPIDKPANVSGAWQTKGEYIGSIFSPTTTTAQVSLIGFEV